MNLCESTKDTRETERELLEADTAYANIQNNHVTFSSCPTDVYNIFV